MAQESPDTSSPNPPPENRKESKKLWLWSRSTNGPVGEGAPGSEPPADDKPAQSAKLNPQEFQANFPAAEGANQVQNGFPSISEAFKSIKSEDFLGVSQTPCARDGFLAGIASGAGVGGLKFVFRGAPIQAANWAVGSFLVGCAASFEYCQWKRRQERVKMKRTVEVYQETMADKRRRETELLEKQRLEEEAVAKANQKAWYKFW